MPFTHALANLKVKNTKIGIYRAIYDINCEGTQNSATSGLECIRVFLVGVGVPGWSTFVIFSLK